MAEHYHEPPLMSIDEDHSLHSNGQSTEIYPDDSVSGFHTHYRRESEEKQTELPSETEGKAMGIEMDHDTSMPSLSIVQKNRNVALYLFDNAEVHPRIKLLAKEPNVVFIKTMSANGIPYSDRYIFYNIKSFEADIAHLKTLLESGKYLRLLISHSGFGVGSGLCIHSPKTWVSFKHAMTNFFDNNSENGLFGIKWHEWEIQSRLYNEQLSPEFNRIHELMQHEIEKKTAQWKLQAHLAYKKQQHQISNARRRIDGRLRDQRRQLQRERAREQFLHQKHLEMRRHNELLKIQKEIERQHAEKNKDLDLRINILHDKMQLHRDQIRKTIAVRDVSQTTHTLLTDYTKNIAANSNEHEDVYNVSKLENMLPNMDVMDTFKNTDYDNDADEIDDDKVVNFWDKMQKIDNDLEDMQQRLSVLRNL